MGCFSRRVVVIAGLLGGLIVALALPAASAARMIYASPGYTWNHVLPKVAPVAPPPPIALGEGQLPHVLVDGAGTGQIAFNTVAPGTRESILRDCVLRRGQTGCSAATSLVPPANDTGFGNGPQTDVDFDGPYPLQIANQLLMLDNRCCNRVPVPDASGFSDGANFLYTSEDGGRTFTGPGVIGTQDPSGNAAIFGGASPQIATVSDTQTGGTFFQASAAGSFTSATVNLGDQGQDEAVNGRVAVDGIRPVVAFDDLSDHIFVREWSGAGDINSAATWSVTQIAGTNSQLVGGPGGVWLVYEKRFHGPLLAQRVVSGVPSGAPTQIAPDESVAAHNDFQIVEDASGHLTAGWFANGQLVIRTSPNGRDWMPAQVIARHVGDVSHLALGAAPDGGGYAAFQRSASGTVTGSNVFAVAFGPITATGHKGLGNQDGGGLGGLGGDPLASASCTDVHFGQIDALAESGCFLRDPSNPAGGAAIAQGPIRLNGLEIIPDAGAKIVIDPRLHSINTTGQVRVVLRAPGLGDITIWHGELHADLAGALAGAGQTLFDFDTSRFGVGLEGFPLEGHIDVQIQHDSVVIPVSVKLPAYMGGISGATTLLADNTHGLRIASLHIGVDDLVLGALEIKNLSVDYTATGDVWKGGATLNIPAGTPWFGVTAQVEFDHGDFTMGSFDVALPYPGVPLFTDVYLNGFGGGFDIHPPRKRFFGSLTVGAIPLDPPNYAITVKGTLSITFQDNGPVIVEVNGAGAIHGFQIATSKLVFQTNGYFEVDGNVDIDLGIAELKAGLKAFVDLPAQEFSSDVSGELLVASYDIASAQSVISSLGIASCGSAFGVNAGFGYPWGGSVQVSVGLGGCDISGYAPQPVSAAARAGRHRAAAATAAVGSGAPFEDIAVAGAGAAPSVELHSPDGRQVVPVTFGGAGAGSAPAVALAIPRNATTYVMVRRPGAGNWTVSAAPGSSAITGVQVARGYAPPAVTAHVAGRGATRRLTYSATARPGLSIAFAERARRVYHVLGRATAAHGTLRFTPANGPAGQRTLYAIVSENGIPRERLTVGSYRPPGPARPGRVHGLHIRRRGGRFLVAFGSAAHASHYLVRVVASDGRRRLTVIAGAAHRFTLPALGYRDRLAVTVTGVSAAQRPGLAVRASSEYQSAVYRRAHQAKRRGGPRRHR